MDLLLGSWKRTHDKRVRTGAGIKHPSYHHGLERRYKGDHLWGETILYPLTTNSLGMKDRVIREVPPVGDRPRIVFIGDSFTEGLGYPYDETFVGRIDTAVGKQGIEVLNAGRSSFCPKLYYLRVKYLLEVEKLKFEHLAVFIDISDPQDEILYEPFEPKAVPIDTVIENKKGIYFDSLIYRQVVRPLRVRFGSKKDRSKDPEWAEEYNFERARWTFDDTIYRKWAKRGLDLCAGNMDSLVKLTQQHGISVSISIYPWPAQVNNQDTASRYTDFWRDYCKQRKIPFLDCFPLIFAEGPAEEILSKLYIPGDCHFNLVGNRRLGEWWLAQAPRLTSGLVKAQ